MWTAAFAQNDAQQQQQPRPAPPPPPQATNYPPPPPAAASGQHYEDEGYDEGGALNLAVDMMATAGGSLWGSAQKAAASAQKAAATAREAAQQLAVAAAPPPTQPPRPVMMQQQQQQRLNQEDRQQLSMLNTTPTSQRSTVAPPAGAPFMPGGPSTTAAGISPVVPPAVTCQATAPAPFMPPTASNAASSFAPPRPQPSARPQVAAPPPVAAYSPVTQQPATELQVPAPAPFMPVSTAVAASSSFPQRTQQGATARFAQPASPLRAVPSQRQATATSTFAQPASPLRSVPSQQQAAATSTFAQPASPLRAVPSQQHHAATSPSPQPASPLRAVPSQQHRAAASTFTQPASPLRAVPSQQHVAVTTQFAQHASPALNASGPPPTVSHPLSATSGVAPTSHLTPPAPVDRMNAPTAMTQATASHLAQPFLPSNVRTHGDDPSTPTKERDNSAAIHTSSPVAESPPSRRLPRDNTASAARARPLNLSLPTPTKLPSPRTSPRALKKTKKKWGGFKMPAPKTSKLPPTSRKMTAVRPRSRATAQATVAAPVEAPIASPAPAPAPPPVASFPVPASPPCQATAPAHAVSVTAPPPVVSVPAPASPKQTHPVAASNKGEAKVGEAVSTLPDGWVESVDPSSGRPYYYHAERNETTWERPVSVVEEAQVEPAVHETEQSMAEPDAQQEPAAELQEEPPKEESRVDALPDGWEECNVPSTGATYYHNVTTQETSWEKPTATRVESEATGAGAPVADAPSKPEQEAVSEDVVVGGEVTERKAVLPQPTTTAEMPAELPEGWTEQLDGTTGQVWYYNTNTQETSWERPQSLVPATTSTEGMELYRKPDEEPNDEARDEIVDVAHPAGEGVVAAETVEESALLEGWTEQIDDVGRTYYYNSTTQETSWDKPGQTSEEARPTEEMLHEEPNQEMLDEGVDGAPPAEDIAADETVEESALPEGWTEQRDGAGRTYYYNSITQDTSWDKPAPTNTEDAVLEQTQNEPDEEPILETLDEVADVSPPAGEVADAAEAAEGSLLAEGWTEQMDDVGQTYYYNSNTQETSWDKPAPRNTEDAVPEPPENEPDEEPIQEALDEGVDVSPPAGSLLAEGWTEQMDDVGRTYYYNSNTQETSWDKPAPTNTEDAVPEPPQDEPDEDPIQESLVADVSPPAGEVIDAAGAVEESLLAEGWTVQKDDVGRTYYYNSITHQTSWNKPAPANTDDTVLELPLDGPDEKPIPEALDEVAYLAPPVDEVAPAAETAEESSLPEGWTEHMDNAGRTYYYNSITQETSWDKPPANTDDVSEPPQKEHDEEPIHPEAFDEVVDIAPPAHEGVADGENVEERSLLEGWTEQTDDVGQTYYYNTITQETSWDKPVLTTDGTVAQQPQEHPDEEPIQEVFDDAEGVGPPIREDDIASETIKEGALPDGWTEEMDDAGRKFYYNSITEDTSWDKPGATTEDVVVEPPQVEIVETTDAVADDGAVPPETGDEPATEVEPAKECSMLLPDGWTEQVSEEGLTYYFNTVTQEATWERPSVRIDSSPGEETAPVQSDADVDDLDEDGALEDVPAEADETSPEAEGDERITPALPRGWTEQRDSASGNVFYYHAERGETTWERPAEEGAAETVESDANTDVQEATDVDDLAEDEAAIIAEEETTEDDDHTTDDEDADLVGTDWTAEVDPSSGKRYYYNRITQESSWGKPVVGCEKGENDDADQEEADEMVLMQSDGARDGSEEGADLPSDPPLPNGWTEQTDESGNTYYYNMETQETCWDHPLEPNEECVEEDEAATDEVEVEEIKPSCVSEGEMDASTNSAAEAVHDDLPEGWTEQMDESSGRPYYFNSSTQESSWEKPVLTESDVGYKTVEKPEIEDADALEETESVVESVGERSQSVLSGSDAVEDTELPAPWTEQVDEGSGRVYYFNTETQESMWERPAVETNIPREGVTEKAVDLPNEPGDSNDTGGEDEFVIPGEDSVESAHRSLPDGWIERVDNDSGRPYFYNVDTQETSWERPIVDTLDAPVEPTNDAVTTTNRGVDGGGADADDLPTSAYDSAPPLSIEPEETTQQVEGAVVTDGRPESTEETLPSGWTRVRDQASGSHFYMNEETGETSWQVPSTSNEAAGEGPATQSGEPETENELSVESHGTRDRTMVPDESLPDGWSQQIDHDSGGVYYINESTGESSWERPGAGPRDSAGASEPELSIPEDVRSVPPEEEGKEGFSETPELETEVARETVEGMTSEDVDAGMVPENNSDAGEASVGGEEETSEELPSGWSAHTDSTNGEVFYYHAESGTTSWEKPTHSDSASAEVVAPVEVTNNERGDAMPVTNVESVGSEPEVVHEGTTSEISAFAGGWEEVQDPGSGQVYYFNRETQETSWERPGGAFALEDSPDGTVDEPRGTSAPEEEVHASAVTNPEDTSHRQDSDGDWSVVSCRDSTQAPESSLPSVASSSDWIEVVDESSGSVYYLNQATNETSWDPPPTDTSVASSGRKEEPETEVGDPDRPDEVTVNNAEDTQDSDEVDGQPGAAEGTSEAGLSSSGESSLATRWEAVKDPSSGDTYYYNRDTGETSWEMPSGVSSIEEVPADNSAAKERENETPERVDNGMDESESSAHSGVEEEPLPAGWVAVQDSTSGDTYYYSEETGETSWERPGGSAGATTIEPAAVDPVEQEGTGEVEEPAQASGGSSSNLPEGWIEVVDDASGDIYYFNETENITSWTKPDGQPDAGVSTETDELPEGWVEVTDPDSGDKYFYNESEQLTSWDPPPGTKDLPSTSSKTTRGERRGAFACFGFGGQLCVFRSTVPRTVAIHKTGELVKSDTLMSMEQDKNAIGVVGPLNENDETLVKSHIEKNATRESYNCALWKIVEIAANSSGRVRSEHGVEDPDSPESAIVKMLLDDQVGQADNPPDEPEDVPQTPLKVSSTSVEDLMLRGKHKAAIEQAINSKNFAMALLIASKCDRTSFERVARVYANQLSSPGMPLHTLAMLLCGQLKSPSTRDLRNPGISSAMWSDGSEALQTTWRKNLAAIISNRGVGWDGIVMALGDQLMLLGEVVAAHVCYMVCGSSVRSPLYPDTRMCLVGCDHLVQMDTALLTPEGLEAFAITEAFEWSRRRGAPNAAIRSVQPFKFCYARLLCDMGLTDAASLYMKSIRACSKIDRNVDEAIPPACSTIYALSEKEEPHFTRAMDEFEDRLELHLKPSFVEGSLDASQPSGKDAQMAPTTPVTPSGQNLSTEELTFHSAQEQLETTVSTPGDSSFRSLPVEPPTPPAESHAPPAPPAVTNPAEPPVAVAPPPASIDRSALPGGAVRPPPIVTESDEQLPPMGPEHVAARAPPSMSTAPPVGKPEATKVCPPPMMVASLPGAEKPAPLAAPPATKPAGGKPKPPPMMMTALPSGRPVATKPTHPLVKTAAPPTVAPPGNKSAPPPMMMAAPPAAVEPPVDKSDPPPMMMAVPPAAVKPPVDKSGPSPMMMVVPPAVEPPVDKSGPPLMMTAAPPSAVEPAPASAPPPSMTVAAPASAGAPSMMVAAMQSAPPMKTAFAPDQDEARERSLPPMMTIPGAKKDEAQEKLAPITPAASKPPEQQSKALAASAGKASTPASKKSKDGDKSVPKAPNSAPAKLTSPPRSGGWLSRLFGTGNAVVADPGEEMKAYYDEKLKRWVFPGDDLTELAKPLPPPPTGPVKKEEKEEEAKPVAASSSDPLAAMMAPPTRAPRSFRRPGAAGSAPRSAGAPNSNMMAMMMPPGAAPMMPGAGSTGKKAPTPSFSVFVQPPAKKGDEKK